MKKKVVILSDFDIYKRPRPYRMAVMLKDNYEVIGIAKECSMIEGIKCLSYPSFKNSKQRSNEENQAIINHCKNNEFDKLIYTPNRLNIPIFLANLEKIDLIIIEDITLLPFGVDYLSKSPSTKILIDLREYYPLEYENNSLWLESFGKFFYYLCHKYLPKVHQAITVSKKIAQKYREVFNIKAEIFYSLPPFYDLQPSEIKDKIQIIYHGFLSPDRKSENLISIAKNLNNNFCLNIMGLSNQKNYLESLKSNNTPNINFLPPIKMQEIIPFCNQFDIGILTLEPNNFNNASAMPNKFFEYIQSRLCVISTPLEEIKHFINNKKIGRVSKDFSIESVSETLNSLSKEEIFSYKLNSHQASQKYSTLTNKNRINTIIQNLVR